MDYLNPKKRKWHLVRLFVGYGLITAGLAAAVVVLFYLVRGFSYKDGVVVQNGMMFISSAPQGAQITLNNTPSGKTNKRIITQAGRYTIQLSRDGYRPWQRTIDLRGGWVQRYSYPLLIPNSLASSPVLTVDGTPSLVSQSPSGRWVLMSTTDSAVFKLVDLSVPATPKITDLTLPSDLAAAGQISSWRLVSWASDNQHVLLEHDYDGKVEFVLVDITDPSQSVDLNSALGESPASIELFNQGASQFWLFDAASHELNLANLNPASIKPYLKNVLAYKTFGNNIVLYATPAADGKTANIVWYQGDQSYIVARGLALASNPSDYLLDLAQFSGDWYVVVGEAGADNVAIYKDPVDYINNHTPNSVVPIYFKLKIGQPNYVEFSTNAEFILAENGPRLAVFDAFYKSASHFSLPGLDAPQAHIGWADGYHLMYVAGGQAVMADFDDLNRQALVGASSSWPPFLDASERYLFTLSTSTDASGAVTTELESTPLRLPADM